MILLIPCMHKSTEYCTAALHSRELAGTAVLKMIFPAGKSAGVPSATGDPRHLRRVAEPGLHARLLHRACLEAWRGCRPK